jgi:hypothetical protein
MNHKELELIEKIRRFRVGKKRKLVNMVEHALALAENRLTDHNSSVQSKREEFKKQKEELITSLKGSRANVNTLYSLQKKELLQSKFVKDSSKQRDEFENQIVDKKAERVRRLKDLWVSEKSLIKIEEYIKLESN